MASEIKCPKCDGSGIFRTRKCNGPEGTQEADTLASVLFDTALTRAQLTTADVAYQLQISESLVRRMRSHDARERVSFAQILALPPSFLLELHRALNAHFGFGRAALLDLLDAAGRVALMVGTD